MKFKDRKDLYPFVNFRCSIYNYYRNMCKDLILNNLLFKLNLSTHTTCLEKNINYITN